MCKSSIDAKFKNKQKIKASISKPHATLNGKRKVKEKGSFWFFNAETHLIQTHENKSE